MRGAVATVAAAAMAVLTARAGAARAQVSAAPLELDERRVVELALASPAAQIAGHERAAAEADARAAARRRWPDVTVSGRTTRLSSLPERFRSLSVPGGERLVLPQLLDSYGARVSLVVPVSDAFLQLAAAAEAAGRLATARRLEEEATRVQVAFEARVAFLTWARAGLAHQVASEAARVAQAERDDQAARVARGMAAPTQLLAFEVAAAEARGRVAGAEAERAVSEALLRGWLPAGEAQRPLVGRQDPLARGEPVETGLALDGAASPPALRAALAQEEAAEARTRAAEWARWPQLAVVASADVAAPSPRAFAVTTLTPVATWEVTAQLSWSLSSLTVGSAAVDRARAEQAALGARAEEARRRLGTERAGARATQQAARVRVEVARQRRAAARQLAEARRQEWRSGTALVVEALGAESEWTRAALAVTDALFELRLAEARLDAASGVTLPRPAAAAPVPAPPASGSTPGSDPGGVR